MALSFIDSLRTEIEQYLVEQSCREVSLLDLIGGKLVYSRPDPDHSHFQKIVGRRLGVQPSLASLTVDQSDPSGPSMKFTGEFECGNLKHVVYKEGVFYLLMDADINSRGHTQWFLFALGNSGLRRAKFSIVNFSKNKSLYSQGMGIWTAPLDAPDKPLEDLSWSNSRACNIEFSETSFPRSKQAGSHYFSVNFDLPFFASNEKILVSYCLPYSFARLDRFVANHSRHPQVQNIELGRSLGNLPIQGLVVTPDTQQQCPTVAVFARTHPGESNGSWVLEGFVDFLLSDDRVARTLRENFVFKIVPMVNPDGVVVGNYRCSLAGVDLNRRWKKTDENLHPEIACTKKFLKKADFFLDLHGHSRHPGFFVYGTGMAARTFARILANLEPENFKPRHCRFTVGRGKRGTARVVANLDLKVRKALTVETSFAAFARPDFKAIGASLAKALLLDHPAARRLLRSLSVSVDSDGQQTGLDSDGHQTEELRTLLSFLEAPDDADAVFAEQDASDSGSDSDPSADNLPDVQERVAALDRTSSPKKRKKNKKNAENRRISNNKPPAEAMSQAMRPRTAVLQTTPAPGERSPARPAASAAKPASAAATSRPRNFARPAPVAVAPATAPVPSTASRPRTAPSWGLAAAAAAAAAATVAAEEEEEAQRRAKTEAEAEQTRVSAWMMRPPENPQLAMRLPLRMSKVGYRAKN